MDNRRRFIIGANLLAVVGAIGYGRWRLDVLPPEMGSLVASDHKWLMTAVVLFIVNFIVAWRYRNVWAVTSSRMLAWAVVAYMGVSHLVDLFGNNWDAISEELLGRSDAPLILYLRARMSAAGALIAMAITGIAIGFEGGESG